MACSSLAWRIKAGDLNIIQLSQAKNNPTYEPMARE
jgi:hypothetical protein